MIRTVFTLLYLCTLLAGVAVADGPVYREQNEYPVLDAMTAERDSLLAFRDSVQAFDAGLLSCQELRSAYVEADERWVAYIVNGMSRLEAGLDSARTSRHEHLTSEAQRLKLKYEVSGCPLP